MLSSEPSVGDPAETTKAPVVSAAMWMKGVEGSLTTQDLMANR